MSKNFRYHNSFYPHNLLYAINNSSDSLYMTQLVLKAVLNVLRVNVLTLTACTCLLISILPFDSIKGAKLTKS